MKKLFYVIPIFLTFISFLFFHSELAASPALILEEVMNLESAYNASKDIPQPNPVSLQPQWWGYFNVDGEELKRRVALTNKGLQELYATLPIEDQTVALPLINKIINTLNALPQAKRAEVSTPIQPRSFLKVYTLEKQLEMNKQIRKLKTEIKLEKERADQFKVRLSKAQKNVDNMMVPYLGQTQPSTKKLLNGLEIMAYRSSIGLGEHNLKASEVRLSELNAKLLKVEEELDFSETHFDASEFNENQLERNIVVFQNELDHKQQDLSAAEANLLEVFNDGQTDRNGQFVREQQLLLATVNRAYAWTKLAFHTFKFNLVLHVNERFQEGQDELRKNLNRWREELNTVLNQAQDWHRAALKEQDRIRQEYTSLISQNEHPDSKAMKGNHSLRQGVLHILTTLELLEDEITNTLWLIDVLDEHFYKNSSFLVNWWIGLTSFVSKTWNAVYAIMNFSLFKISEIPITLLTLLKIAIIISLSFWLSMFVRKSIMAFGKKQEDVAESTLYSLSSLAYYFILLIGFLIAVCSIGLDFSNMLFIVGAVTFGVSLGLQSIANNFFCGLRILFESKLKVGDYIELNSGHTGKVEEIHVQNTMIRTSDGQRVIVPNSELIGNTLVNWARQHQDFRRLHIPFAVASGSDKELVRSVVVEAAKKVPCVLSGSGEFSDPQVWLVNFGSHALEFKLVVWVDYKGEAYSDSKEADFLWAIETALRSQNIALPHVLHHLLPNLKHTAALNYD